MLPGVKEVRKFFFIEQFDERAHRIRIFLVNALTSFLQYSFRKKLMERH